MAKGSNARAALLTLAMSVMPVAPVDLFRFLNIPAIVLTIRQTRGRLCRDVHHRAAPSVRAARRAR